MTDLNGLTPLSEARAVADKFIALIADRCTYLKIAGSVRRGKPQVKDIEIVAIPAPGLLERLDMLIIDGKISKAMYQESTTGKYKPRWGDTYRGIDLTAAPGIKIELFLADQHNVGWIEILRSGPGEANQALVKPIRYRSPFLLDGGYVWWEKGDHVSVASRRISIPNEAALFALFGLPHLPPDQRSVQAYQQAYAVPSHRWGTPQVFADHTPVYQTSLF